VGTNSKKEYKTELSQVIESVDDEVSVNEDGFEYYLCREVDVMTKNRKNENVILIGRNISVRASTVEKLGADAIVGARLQRVVPV